MVDGTSWVSGSSTSRSGPAFNAVNSLGPSTG